MNLRLKLIFIALSSLICFDIHCQEIIFFKEDVTFRLSEKHFMVDGNYYFNNRTNKRINRLMFFPVSNANDKNIIDSISVFNLTRYSKDKIIKKTENGIYFELAIEANDTSIYHIEYHQKIIGHNVEYVLQTTQNWKRPLDIAEYKLLVEKPLKVKSLSYEPNKVYQIQGMKIYYWRKEKFLPNKDIIIHFAIN